MDKEEFTYKKELLEEHIKNLEEEIQRNQFIINSLKAQINIIEFEYNKGK